MQLLLPFQKYKFSRQSLLWTEALHFELVTLPNFSFYVSEIPFIKRSITQKAYRGAFRFESLSFNREKVTWRCSWCLKMAENLAGGSRWPSNDSCLQQIALVRKQFESLSCYKTGIQLCNKFRHMQDVRFNDSTCVILLQLVGLLSNFHRLVSSEIESERVLR